MSNGAAAVESPPNVATFRATTRGSPVVPNFMYPGSPGSPGSPELSLHLLSPGGPGSPDYDDDGGIMTGEVAFTAIDGATEILTRTINYLENKFNYSGELVHFKKHLQI